MISIHWVQHPIGHGGFHTGHLEGPNGERFNWAFDCGARRTRQFDTYLRNWTRSAVGPLDWLFISHFDTDHVSGLDTLMSRMVVRDVMVPYLNERELAYLLLHEISRDNLDRSLVELAADPAAYFLSRGAERVTFLGGRGREGELGTIDSDPDPRDGRGWICKLQPQPSPLKAPLWASGKSRPSKVRRVDTAGCQINVVMGPVGLRLKPYRAPIIPFEHRGLIKAIQALVGTTAPLRARPGLAGLAYGVANHARTSVGRAALRKIFKSYVGSSNRASLSLLSEPVINDENNCCWHLHHSYSSEGGPGLAAWLNTGDAELLKARDLHHWENWYAAELQRVRALALPHHGSDKNSDEDFQDLCPAATLIAHVKATSTKHPGPDVILTAGPRLACVTEDTSSRIDMWFRGR